jgi:hypothetical protein
MFDLQAAIAEAVQTGPDMNNAKSFEDKAFPLPAEGLARLRFIRYIELGKSKEVFKAGEEPKIVEKVHLAFELSGPRHKPIIGEDGKQIPFVIETSMNMSLTEKSKFYKLFVTMNHDKTARHMAQLLGKSFVGTVVHKTVGTGDQAKTYANLADANGPTIRAPFVPDPLTGETITVEAEPPISPLKLFIWNTASKAMWDSLYIEGSWPDKLNDKGEVVTKGKSKNRFQNLIRSAINFEGSPASQFVIPGAENLEAAIGGVEDMGPRAGEGLDYADQKPSNTGGAASDPLAGII